MYCIYNIYIYICYIYIYILYIYYIQASGGVHALLVLEPTECSTSTRLGA